MTEQRQKPPGLSDLIEVVFDARSVSLAVRPAQGDDPPASVDQAVAALRRGPFAAVSHQRVAEIVNAQTGDPVLVGEVPVPPDVTGWFVVVSPDVLAAYLVPAPPAKSDDPDVALLPRLLSSAKISKQLKEFEVNRGVLDDVVASFDPPRVLETIECVALGQPPVEGRDAVVEVLIDDQEDHHPVTREDGSVDHHANVAARFVEGGAVIATREPPGPGTAGVDVSGRPVEPHPVVDHLLDGLVGQNTEIEGDQLIATAPGRPVRNGERIDLLHSYEVAGDLNYAVGNIEFDGDVTVRGDVKPGFSIVATGSVVIGGVLEHSSIKAGGDISVQGVIGEYQADGWMEDAEHTTMLEAGGDVHAQYLHAVTVRAAGEVRVNREIVNCAVRAGRVETAPGARIVGGEVVAETDIAAGSIGSPNGTHTELQIRAHRSEEPLVVRAWDAAHAGIQLNVSSAVLAIEDDLPGASFWQLDGEVVRLDPLATLRDVIAFAEETGRRPPSAPSDEEAGHDEERPAA